MPKASILSCTLIGLLQSWLQREHNSNSCIPRLSEKCTITGIGPACEPAERESYLDPNLSSLWWSHFHSFYCERLLSFPSYSGFTGNDLKLYAEPSLILVQLTARQLTTVNSLPFEYVHGKVKVSSHIEESIHCMHTHQKS